MCFVWGGRGGSSKYKIIKTKEDAEGLKGSAHEFRSIIVMFVLYFHLSSTSCEDVLV